MVSHQTREKQKSFPYLHLIQKLPSGHAYPLDMSIQCIVKTMDG